MVSDKKVHGDSVKPEPKNSKRPKKRKEISARPRDKRVEPGNPTSRAMPETGIQEDIA